LITTITAPADPKFKVKAGDTKAVAKDYKFTHNMTDWTVDEICGAPTATITGTGKDLLSYAAGKLTLTLKKDTKPGTYTATVKGKKTGVGKVGGSSA